ncbi:hypothetical protein FQN55_009519 [Onygenales sp. PD_40]|nr:hypothetical protein FQN55_009519 [Onygenales sp. PD_40]
MSEITSLWWTDERVDATISRDYILEHLDPEFHAQLESPLPFGDGLTDDTYLDWVLEKGRKLFLILSDIGIPERVFAIVEEACDDEDLPLSAQRVNLLPLSPSDTQDASLSKKFFNAQWRFLVKSIKPGDHVIYGENEGVPVELVAQRTNLPLTSRDCLDKVIVAGAVCKQYLRTRITIGGIPHFLEKEEIMREIEFLKMLAHEHVISAYASYFVDDSINMLIIGIPEYSLKSFLNDRPQQFKRLTKPEQRYLLLTWPHCLADGLAWLHSHGQAHGAIRPSNVLIDSNNRIYLGLFEAFGSLVPLTRQNDIEAYQYAAPEGWVRTASIQSAGSGRNALPSGGRTAAKHNSIRPGSAQQQFNMRGISYRATEESYRSPESPSRMSYASSSSTSSTTISATRRHIPGFGSAKHMSHAPTISSSSSSSGATSRPLTMMNSTTLNINTNPPLNNVIVQTWQSHQSSALPADIFALAAITVDIYTILCKRRHSAFVAHRGAKNRYAGRGGSVADVSFHLDRNSEQVKSWITRLERDALRRADVHFRGVRPVLAVVRDMLSRDPESRPLAPRVASEFAWAINQAGGGIQAHCKPTAEASPHASIRSSAAINIPTHNRLPPSPLSPHCEEPEPSRSHSSSSSHFSFNFGHTESDEDDDDTILEQPYEPSVVAVSDEQDEQSWRVSSLLPIATSPPTTPPPNSHGHYSSSHPTNSGVFSMSPGQRKFSPNNNFSRPFGNGQWCQSWSYPERSQHAAEHS